MWVNIIFLAFIALVPFTTSILRAFYGTQISVIAYGMNLVICGIALYWLWAHAVDEKLLEEGIDEQMADAMKYRILIPVAIALLTTMIALVSPFTSIILFALLFLLVTVPTSNDVIVSLFQKK